MTQSSKEINGKHKPIQVVLISPVLEEEAADWQCIALEVRKLNSLCVKDMQVLVLYQRNKVLKILLAHLHDSRDLCFICMFIGLRLNAHRQVKNQLMGLRKPIQLDFPCNCTWIMRSNDILKAPDEPWWIPPDGSWWIQLIHSRFFIDAYPPNLF